MTTIRQTALRLIGSSMIAAAMLAGGHSATQAKELCFEECTFELMGSCWRWKKACLNLTVEGRDAAAENSTRRADRQQIPSRMDSLLAGGLSTALGGETFSLGPVRSADIMN
jgi:hypothetical protein